MQSKERAKDLYRELVYDGINVDVIHAERTQQQREDIIRWERAATYSHRAISLKIFNMGASSATLPEPVLSESSSMRRCHILNSHPRTSPWIINYTLQYTDGFALVTSGC